MQLSILSCFTWQRDEAAKKRHKTSCENLLLSPADRLCSSPPLDLSVAYGNTELLWPVYFRYGAGKQYISPFVKQGCCILL